MLLVLERDPTMLLWSDVYNNTVVVSFVPLA